ncbi:hypothetical protein BITS_0731 [Bifidobacterium tsurumiense]|uniref:Uncharacterized protein n=1 Tax=Bifidobacterium tsurumiense TaxID=356829 RepID=A0A087EI80_9BIFI|nr:hypothetical protein BITS_0731 [Bifidobacterium tsurumiense]
MRCSVRFLEVVIESGHVKVAYGAPIVCRDVAYARAYEHECAVGVGKAAYDPGASPDFPVEPFDHVVRPDPPAVLGGESVQQVGRGLADAFPQTAGRGPEFP